MVKGGGGAAGRSGPEIRSEGARRRPRSEEKDAEVGKAGAGEQRDHNGKKGDGRPTQGLKRIGKALGALGGRGGEDLADRGPRRGRGRSARLSRRVVVRGRTRPGGLALQGGGDLVGDVGGEVRIGLRRFARLGAERCEEGCVLEEGRRDVLGEVLGKVGIGCRGVCNALLEDGEKRPIGGKGSVDAGGEGEDGCEVLVRMQRRGELACEHAGQVLVQRRAEYALQALDEEEDGILWRYEEAELASLLLQGVAGAHEPLAARAGLDLGAPVAGAGGKKPSSAWAKVPMSVV